MDTDVGHRALIVNADDFGAHVDINAAVELAARAGTLSAASLMVSAPAAQDALARARSLPRLRVGLHLTLIDGEPTLPIAQIPLLVDARHRFPDDMLAFSLRLFANRDMRAQMRAEIRAQFEAFAATGLTLDHVNTHKHFHLHPTLLDMILDIGPDYGMKALRVPYEPLGYVWHEPHSRAASMANAALTPILERMKRRATKCGMSYCDRVYGIRWSGAMTQPRILSIIERLPPGTTEVYMHPALRSGAHLAATMGGYQNTAELEALLSAELAAALAHRGLTPCGYADLPMTASFKEH